MRLRRNPFTGGKNKSVNRHWQRYLKRSWFFSISDKKLEKCITTEKELNLTQDAFISGWQSAFKWMDEEDQKRTAKRGVRS